MFFFPVFRELRQWISRWKEDYGPNRPRSIKQMRLLFAENINECFIRGIGVKKMTVGYGVRFMREVARVNHACALPKIETVDTLMQKSVNLRRRHTDKKTLLLVDSRNAIEFDEFQVRQRFHPSLF